MNAFLRSYTMILFLPLFLCSSQSIVFQQYAGPFSAGITPFRQLFDGSVCIGSEREGVLRSFDDGRNWSRENGGLPGNSVVSLCIDPASRILYAALRGGGIYRFDGGLRRWVRSGEAPMAYPAIMLSQNGSMYALDSAHTVLRSSDGGGTWQAAFVPAEHGISDVLCGAVHGEAIILGTQLAGVFTSLDQGATWTNSYTRIPPVRAVFYSSSGIAFASNTKETIRSTDKGASWSVVPTGPESIRSFSEDGNGVLWSTGGYSSTDTGLTWQPRAGAGNSLHVARTATGSVLFAQQYRGISRLADTTSTSEYVSFDFPNVPTNIAVPALAATRAGTLLASQQTSTFRSTNAGLGWTRVRFGTLGEAGALRLAADTMGHVFALLRDCTLWRSDNEGVDWQHFTPDSAAPKSIQQLFVRPNGEMYAASMDQQLWRTTDLGASWRSTVLPGIVRALCVVGEHVVLAGTETSTYRSLDDGATFRLSNGTAFTAFHCDADGAVVNAGSFYGMHRSTDAGQTWKATYRDPQSRSLSIVSFLRAGEGRLLAGGAGVFASSDNGESWTMQGTTLQPRPTEWTLLPDGSVLAATPSLGLMVGRWQTPTGAPPAGAVPLPALTISAAWPNPASVASSITVSLQRRVSLRCDVYTLLGERVATLCDDMRGEGVHTLTWGGRNASGATLPSGTYIMSVHADDAIATRTLLWFRR